MQRVESCLLSSEAQAYVVFCSTSCAAELYLYTGIQIECVGQWLHYLSRYSAAVLFISLQNVVLAGYDHNSEQAVQGCRIMITLPCTQN